MDHDYHFKARIIESKPIYSSYEIMIENSTSELETITSEWVINTILLKSDMIAKMLNIDEKIPELIYSIGCYFKLSSKWRNRFKYIVYLLPDIANDNVGIYLSFNQTGKIKLGPTTRWLKTKIEDCIAQLPDTLKALKYILYRSIMQESVPKSEQVKIHF